MLVGTLTNILVKKFLGRKFIPRFAKYLIKFPDYLSRVCRGANNFIIQWTLDYPDPFGQSSRKTMPDK